MNSHTVAAQTFTHLFVVSSRQRSMIGRDVKNKNYDKINLIEKTMNTTLLIMAAGIGSRFGTGIKQLEPVDGKCKIIRRIVLP